MKKPAKDLQIGDKIWPPEREMVLWMRRDCRDKGWPETVLQLTVIKVYEGAPDKRGPWLWVVGRPTEQWCSGYVKPDPTLHPFKFKVRPDTPWPTVTG